MSAPAVSVLDRAAEIIAAFVPDSDLVDLLTQLQSNWVLSATNGGADR